MHVWVYSPIAACDAWSVAVYTCTSICTMWCNLQPCLLSYIHENLFWHLRELSWECSPSNSHLGDYNSHAIPLKNYEILLILPSTLLVRCLKRVVTLCCVYCNVGRQLSNWIQSWNLWSLAYMARTLHHQGSSPGWKEIQVQRQCNATKPDKQYVYWVATKEAAQ